MGPKLPEHLASLSGEVPSESSGSSLYGPALPPLPLAKESEHKDMGPKLPEHLASLSGEVPSESSGSGLYGPALPPRPPANESELKDIGPKLPPYLANSSGDIADTDSDSDEEFMIGPIPVSGDASRNTSAAEEFEARAKKMKDKLTGQTKEMPAERESWMIELPPEMGKNFGLGPRTFRKRASCGDKDKSAWTDTPADKERKAKEAWERHEKGLRKPKRERPPPPAISAKEKELADQMESYNKKKRSESLIDMHTNKLSKKKKEEGEKPNERKEFDRDTDLQVNRFDDARRRAAMKKAVGLNDRFSSGGHTSKFL
ncbi:PREDICTED: GPALPP motifs-containing protein 1-like isoform X5 [Priapulus caudatus]|uniref:GPALPP motifs-containing protein 1-like isoform X5 n=1 Tax=Priapulus caudatus TaxID=37621 RepID=A0ABM1EZ83_PRICU|nr:PREDICTED: GPALPP motifs-containing protein 1-like isoform X5 [Priapulus caudatus]